MWDFIVRRYRVEVALFRCYFESLYRGDVYSKKYCAERSILVQVALLIGVFSLLIAIGFALTVLHPMALVLLVLSVLVLRS